MDHTGRADVPGLAARRGEPRPTADDLTYHLSTLFPPVRPRGHLEYRVIDAQPGDGWIVPTAVVTALLDDPAASQAAMAATALLCGTPDELWLRAARCGLGDPQLAAAARKCFAAADAALGRLGAPAAVRDAVTAFADRYVRAAGAPPTTCSTMHAGRKARRTSSATCTTSGCPTTPCPPGGPQMTATPTPDATRPAADTGDGQLRELIASNLLTARERTQLLTDAWTTTDLVRQHSPLMSPLVWDLAHVANQEELWLLRAVGGREPMHPEIDPLYDAFEHPRAERPTLPLLPPAEARAYAHEVRGRVLDLLEAATFSGTRLLTGASRSA